jgi:hypothetical protein
MTNSISIQQAKLSFTFLFSGLALMVFIFSGLHLFFSILLFFAPSLFLFHRISQQLTTIAKRTLKADIKNGVYIGILATFAYDIVRFLLYTTGAVNFFPFETFHLFGNALVGENVSYNFAFGIGTCYHILNGITFSIAYRISFKDKNYIWGIISAMALELLMLISYLNWINLNLNGKMTDFLIVSMVGHFSYGATVGLLNQNKFKTIIL